MKKICFLLTIIFLILSIVSVAATLTIRPDACEGKDAINGLIVPNTNYGSSEDFDVYAWTQSGNLNINRAYIDFNLSMIPAYSVINSAHLYLYYNPTNSGGYTHSGNNAFSIYRIVSPWSEDSITWNNQPFLDSSVVVNVAASSSGTQDYIIDVSTLLQNIVNDAANSYGFSLSLDDENPFNVVMFASSDHPDSSLHPMLVIDYTPFPIVTNCSIHMQPGAVSGIDAIDGYIVPNTNYGSSEDFDAYAWTQSGNLNINRGYINFDLSSIPVGAVISNATLSLFYNPTNSGGYTHSGNNAFSLYRITSPWTENGITWNNRPAIDSSVIINVPASTSGTQDYSIDVSWLVQIMVNNPANSYGFNMRLDDETPFNVVMFASSDHPDCNLHPMLDVSYTFIDNVEDPGMKNNLISIFPNPLTNSGTITFHNPKNSSLTITITDVIGKCVYKKNKVTGTQTVISKSNLASGFYTVNLYDDVKIIGSRKLIVE